MQHAWVPVKCGQPSLRAITPAVALTLGVVLLACLLALGVNAAAALAAAGIAAAATGVRVHGQLAAIRTALALTPARRRALATAHTAAFLVPATVLAARYTGPVLALALAAGAGMPCGIFADRSLRKAEFSRLATGPVGATSVRQAARIVGDCERLLERPLAARARAFAELNLADALTQSMQAIGIQQRLDRALGLLRRISADPDLDPGFTEMAAMSVMDVADAHAALTDDLGTYEAAIREAEDTVQHSGQFSGHLAARVQRQRADLLHARAEVEFAAAAAGAPGMHERARVTITEALETLEAARLAGSPPNADWHLWRSGLLSQLAMLDADPNTHDAAVTEARAAIASARHEPPDLRALNAAGASVVFQAAVGDGADPALLDEAIGHMERVMRHHLDSEIRGRLQAQRASLLADRKGSWDRALVGEFRRAFESEHASPYGSITRARGWADAAADAGLAAEAAEAYSRGLGVMSELVSGQLTRRLRGGPLRHGQGMAAEAAYWLVRERRLEEAAVALETGRAVSATRVMQREAVQAELRRRGHHVLADDYAEAVRHLGELERGSPSGTYHLAASTQRQVCDLEAAQQRYRGLCLKVEALDGFRDAFRPAMFADIARAAGPRPVVYVTAAKRAGLALIVSGAESHAVPLPELTLPQLTVQIGDYRQGLTWLRQQRWAQWRACLNDMITWLSAATEPLWAALDRFNAVTVVPGGPLSLLPLHAAKNSPQPAIAFAPNARIVAAAGQQKAARPGRVLVVAPMTEDPGVGDIDAELAAASAHAAGAEVLRGAAATRDRVLAEFPRWSAYHFTCHGHADDDDPLASGLQLSDGLLTVGDILAHRAPGAHLAILSACESSIPHADLLDEALGLPAAMMEAGMQGAIGALWRVEPRPTLLLMRHFYQRWNDGDHPAIALQHAQHWLRDATNEDIREIDSAPAPGRITGAGYRAWESKRPYAHPDYWAAFTYTGI